MAEYIARLEGMNINPARTHFFVDIDILRTLDGGETYEKLGSFRNRYTLAADLVVIVGEIVARIEEIAKIDQRELANASLAEKATALRAAIEGRIVVR